ncbi:MAG: type II toxin-antitoxin system RelE/ParE family toxin [Nanoarchaeota archaeon]
MYELIYSSKALKSLEKLEKSVQERILSALERLRIRPESYDIKKLVGVNGYRFRAGDYRIIFDLDKEKLIIFVIKIGHRKNIYE